MVVGFIKGGSHRQSFQRLLNARLSCYALKNPEIRVFIIAP